MKPIFCEVCEKIYASVRTLTHHKKTHALDYKSPCDNCHKQFRTKHLKRHMLLCSLKKENNPQENECNFCNKKFDQIRYLKQHLKVHDTLAKVSCNVCSKIFASKANLKNHIQRLHEIKCGENVLIVDQKKKKPYCKMCNMLFHKNGNLKRHINKKHKYFDENRSDRLVFGDNIFIIEENVPDKAFKTQTKEEFTCSVCNKTFSSKKSLSDHKLKVHQPPVPCPECAKKLKSGYSLRRHMTLVHTNHGKPKIPKRKRDPKTPNNEYSRSWKYKKAKLLTDDLVNMPGMTPGVLKEIVKRIYKNIAS